jgi:hypothetical protein
VGAEKLIFFCQMRENSLIKQINLEIFRERGFNYIKGKVCQYDENPTDKMSQTGICDILARFSHKMG